MFVVYIHKSDVNKIPYLCHIILVYTDKDNAFIPRLDPDLRPTNAKFPAG